MAGTARERDDPVVAGPQGDVVAADEQARLRATGPECTRENEELQPTVGPAASKVGRPLSRV